MTMQIAEQDLERGRLFEFPEPRAWSAAYTRNHQEERLADYLLDRGVPSYVPKMIRSTEHTVRLPLLSGLVFFVGSGAERQLAAETNLVQRFFEVKDTVQLDQELSCIWRLQNRGAPCFPHPYIEPWDQVRVTAGILEGLVGTVLRLRRQTRLVLPITAVRQAVATNVDSTLLEPMLVV